MLTVTDSGVGIPPDEIQAIFTRGYRATTGNPVTAPVVVTAVVAPIISKNIVATDLAVNGSGVATSVMTISIQNTNLIALTGVITRHNNDDVFRRHGLTGQAFQRFHKTIIPIPSRYNHGQRDERP